MIKVFLIGGYRSNCGPDNINRSYIENSNGRILCINYKNIFTKYYSYLFNYINCDCVLFSGACKSIFLILAKLFRKKIFFIMHGDAIFENEINKLSLSKGVLNNQVDLMREAKAIFAVSETYSNWLKERYPEFAEKIDYVNNGVNIKQREKKEKEKFSFAVTGGNLNIKNNASVYSAYKLLKKKGIDCKFYVFGDKYINNQNFISESDVVFLGNLDKENYYSCLDKISLMIVASEVESFGLCVADAVNCNCSLLISKNVGAKSIFDLFDEDVIMDNHSINEISKKIEFLINNPNSERLYYTIDLDGCSEKQSCETLLRKIENYCGN